MDFSRCESPSKLSFSTDGRYLYSLPFDFPIKLLLYRYDRPYPAIPNYHDHYELCYILKGRGTFMIAGKEYPAREGGIFSVRSGAFHFFKPANPARTETLALYFAREVLHSPGSVDANLEYLLMFDATRSAAKIALDEASRAKVLDSLQSIATELQDRRDFYRIAVKNALCDILLVLNRLLQVRSKKSPIPSLALRDANRLRPVFDLIHRGYTERLKLSELASAANIGQTSFCRYFKRVTGLTVMDYLRRYRIDQAKELLLSTDRPVTWIAYESGFESHSHFDRVFRSVANLTPQEFRNRYAPKVSAVPPPTA